MLLESDCELTPEWLHGVVHSSRGGKLKVVNKNRWNCLSRLLDMPHIDMAIVSLESYSEDVPAGCAVLWTRPRVEVLSVGPFPGFAREVDCYVRL